VSRISLSIPFKNVNPIVTMKPLLLTAALLGFTLVTQAADTTPPTTTKPTPAAPGTKKADEPKTDEKAPKVMPMNHKVDVIDAAKKTLTYTTQKGKTTVNVITDKTVIMQGDKPAAFTDIKVGDVVAGSHIQKSEGVFEVVKITKFGPAESKEDKKKDKEEKAAPAPTPAPPKGK
jgi:hypothetical protein